MLGNENVGRSQICMTCQAKWNFDFICNQLSHTFHRIYHVRKRYNSSLHGPAKFRTLLLPVRLCHVENLQTWLHTLLYTFLWWRKFKAITFINVTCIFHSHSHLLQNIHFSDLQKFTLSTSSEKLEVRYNDAVTCLWSLSYSVTI